MRCARSVRQRPATRRAPRRTPRHRASRHQPSGDAVHHGLERPARRQGDHRGAAGHRFDRDDPEILFARAAARRARRPVERPDVLVATPSRGTRLRTRSCAFNAVEVGPRADDLQGHAGHPAGVDGHVDPFVGHQRRHDQAVPARTSRSPDGRSRCPRAGTRRPTGDYSIGRSCWQRIEKSPHSGPAGVRLRHPNDPGGPSTGRMTMTQGAQPRRAEVRVELIPGIPHRGEAVAEVPRPAGAARRLHRAVARRNHQVEAVQVELLDRRRERVGADGDTPEGPAADG